MDTPFVFKKFGQLVEIPEELAAGHPHLVTPEVWNSVGFTEEETKAKWFGAVSAHRNAPAEFIAKRNTLWANPVVQDGPVAIVKEEDTNNG
jgi:hypothetical protein